MTGRWALSRCARLEGRVNVLLSSRLRHDGTVKIERDDTLTLTLKPNAKPLAPTQPPVRALVRFYIDRWTFQGAMLVGCAG